MLYSLNILGKQTLAVKKKKLTLTKYDMPCISSKSLKSSSLYKTKRILQTLNFISPLINHHYQKVTSERNYNLHDNL